MPLDNLSQPNLERSVEILISNGGLPQAQSALASVGYTPESLQAAAALLNTWRSHLTQAQTLLTGQKRATQAGQQARRTAQTEIGRFSRTVRTLFGSDETVLRSLGLQPSRRANGAAETNGSTEAVPESSPGRVSQSATATIVRWRRMWANAQNLSEAHKSRLATAGWPAERLVGAAALVEAFAQANIQHQQVIQTYRAQMTVAKAAELELRQWYNEARQLVRLAIEQADRDDKAHLRDLLSL